VGQSLKRKTIKEQWDNHWAERQSVYSETSSEQYEINEQWDIQRKESQRTVRQSVKGNCTWSLGNGRGRSFPWRTRCRGGGQSNDFITLFGRSLGWRVGISRVTEAVNFRAVKCVFIPTPPWVRNWVLSPRLTCLVAGELLRLSPKFYLKGHKQGK